MDEPFSNLDHVLRRTLRREIREILAGSGCGVIMVTHEPDDALSMADQITLLRAGRVQQQGSPEEMYHQPQTAYAAHFFGRANIIQVRKLLPLLQKEEAGRQLAEALSNHQGSALCIRAEDLVVSTPGRAQLTGKVGSIRFFGAFEEATLALQADTEITLLIPPGSLQPGQVTGVHIRENQWHLIQEEGSGL
jgi:iron(III) transport system ATP-binding protein